MSKLIHPTGYVMILKPNHHRAEKNGYVYEHIIIAEEMLGRKLRQELLRKQSI